MSIVVSASLFVAFFVGDTPEGREAAPRSTIPKEVSAPSAEESSTTTPAETSADDAAGAHETGDGAVVESSDLSDTDISTTSATHTREQKDPAEAVAAEMGASSAAASPETHEPEHDNAPYYSVLSVVDGDTVNISVDGQKESVRLIGIDTPETVHPSKPVECFGREASKEAKTLMGDERVRLEYDDSQGWRDKYDRLLAYVFLEDGTHVNKHMVEEGYAYEYTYNLPYRYQDEFKAAQTNARENGRGLWADGACESGKTEAPATSAETVSTYEPPETTAVVSGGGKCHPDYSGCLRADAEDYDCKDGAGNGPYYTGKVQIIGTDVFGLDGDEDGFGCE